MSTSTNQKKKKQMKYRVSITKELIKIRSNINEVGNRIKTIKKTKSWLWDQ